MPINLKINKEVSTTHVNQFVVTVDGYYGDMDSYIHEEEVFNASPTSDMHPSNTSWQKFNLHDYLDVLYYIKNNKRSYPQQHQVMVWLKEMGLADLELEEQLHDYDQGYPTHIDISVQYFDDSGIAYDVVVEQYDELAEEV